MPDKKLSNAQKESLTVLRARMGGVSEAKRQSKKQWTADRKAIVATLGNGPATVPEIATATALPKQHVLWHVAGMRKYGQVADGQVDGDYLRYALVKDR